MYLLDVMQLNKLEKEQLIELCSALYELLQQRQTNFVVSSPVPAPTPVPVVYPTNPYPFSEPWKITCGETNTINTQDFGNQQ